MAPRRFPLTLLRHGITEIPEGCCFGQLDVVLSASGRDAIGHLANRWPQPYPERIICSDLSRARQTAEILARQMGIPVTPDSRLREMCFGNWEGKTWEEIHRQDPHTMQRWGSDWLNIAPPGGENLRDLDARVWELYQEILKLPPLPTLIVAHAGSLRALACRIQARPLEQLFDTTFLHATPVSMV